jgi:hypothetical protein
MEKNRVAITYLAILWKEAKMCNMNCFPAKILHCGGTVTLFAFCVYVCLRFRDLWFVRMSHKHHSFMLNFSKMQFCNVLLFSVGYYVPSISSFFGSCLYTDM